MKEQGERTQFSQEAQRARKLRKEGAISVEEALKITERAYRDTFLPRLPTKQKRRR